MPDQRMATHTYLMTDVERSTELWRRHPDSMWEALGCHDEIVQRTVIENRGDVVKGRGEGDSFFCVFEQPQDAVAAALDLQLAIAAEDWPSGCAIRVRAAVHVGEAYGSHGDYYGPSVNRCARLRAIGHGGQTLLSGATEAAVRNQLPQGTSLRYLGSHRLRDLLLAEEVYQLVHPELQLDFEPLVSLSMAVNNLPVYLTSFVGRQTHIAAIGRALNSDRLITLTGVGGCGKTRLALQAAAEFLDRYPEGAWAIGLGPLDSAVHVAGFVAGELGLREQKGQQAADALVDHLSTSRALLILDNCEHLVAQCADLASTLLARCPRLQIIATSREPLGVAGERLLRVASLSVPTAQRTDATSLMASESGQLFVERARLVRGDIEINDENAAAVGDICRRLDGLPLAIELAAARVDVLSIHQISRRLADRFRLLVRGPRTMPPRHQALSAVVDWSYGLLEPTERLLFDRLSVFSGSFALGAAERVGADGEVDRTEVLDLLQSLVAKSMVNAVEDVGDEVRFRVLETLREYGRVRLEERGPEERAGASARHASYFAAFAMDAAPELMGSKQAYWLDRLQADHPNLRTALGWLRDCGRPVEALHMSSVLWRYWRSRGHLREGLEWIEELLERTKGSCHHVERVTALVSAGNLAYYTGNLAAARDYYEEQLEAARDMGDDAATAAALDNLGVALHDQGHSQTALRYHNESLTIRTALDDQAGMATTLANLGRVNQHLGEYAAAQRCFEDSLKLSEALGDHATVGSSLTRLGNLATNLGDFEGAEEYLNRSLEILERVGDRHARAQALNVLGFVNRLRGDHDRARERQRECLELSEEMGFHWIAASALEELGRVEHELCNHSEARTNYLRSLQCYDELGAARQVVSVRLCQAAVMLSEGDNIGAEALARECLEAQRETRDWRGVAQSLALIGRLSCMEGNLGAARGAIRESLQILLDLGDKRQLVYGIEAAACLACDEGDYVHALRLVGCAESQRESLGTPTPPREKAVYGPYFERASASVDETESESASRSGRAMDLGSAVCEAIAALDHAAQ